MHKAAGSLRLALICLSALSISLPMAWISLAKVLVMAVGLAYLGASFLRGQTDTTIGSMWTPRVLMVMVLWFVSSIFWTGADMQSALTSVMKHAKLIEIALLVCLIRTPAEARIGMSAFATGQIFLLLSSWLMFLGVPIPWSADAPTPYVVFSTYLDQSIMFATTASVFWHLRKEKLWPEWMGTLLALLALVNTLLVLEGRSGYVVALTSLSLAIMWAMPPRLRLAAMIITPAVVLMGLSLGSSQVQERVSKIFRETENFAKTQQVEIGDSSGWRLNAWRRSLQAIEEKPLVGHGVGNWTPTVKRLEGGTATQVFGKSNQSNPHQEYLLWGVELGIGGLLLLVGMLVCMARDALRFPPSIRRATLAFLAATAVACLFNSALYDDLMGDFFCVGLGILMALGARSTVTAPVQTFAAGVATRSGVIA